MKDCLCGYLLDKSNFEVTLKKIEIPDIEYFSFGDEKSLCFMFQRAKIEISYTIIEQIILSY